MRGEGGAGTAAPAAEVVVCAEHLVRRQEAFRHRRRLLQAAAISLHLSRAALRAKRRV